PEWWRQRPDATYYGVPVATGEAFAGVLGYVSPHGPPPLEVQDVLRLLAAQAAVAVNNAALYEAERRQAARIRALAAVNRRISSALELDDLLRQISVLAAELTGTRFASFWIADEERRTLTLTSASASEMLEDFAPRVLTYEVGGVGEVLARLARELTASLEVERIAALLARGILELVKVQRAAVLRYEPDDSTLRVIAVAGVAAEAATDFVLRAGEGVAGRAIAE